MRLAVFAWCSLVLAGCATESGASDGATDSAVDAAAPGDAGSDAGSDGGTGDAGPTDTGPTDAGPTDLGTVDAGPQDECADGTASCLADATCVDTPLGYYCRCPDGLVGDGVTDCVAIGACDGITCAARASCVTTPGGPECRCDPGTTTGVGGCVDVDECADPWICGSATCVNFDGGYRCEGGGLTAACVVSSVIPESHCLRCESDTHCADCEPGFTQSGSWCVDVVDCADVQCPLITVRDAGGAEHLTQGLCVNVPGSYRCDCPPGAPRDPATGYCVDVDECATGAQTCDTVCLNAPAGYWCVHCAEGYLWSQGLCIDVDECMRGTCDPLAACSNTPGSFTCTCPTGTVGDGVECARDCTSAACPSGASCRAGSCDCPDTSLMEGGTCVACPTGTLDCNDRRADGCESDAGALTSCGACGVTCAATEVCAAGHCVELAESSTGADGAFAPTTSMVLPAGVYDFTTITIPAGVTITTDGTGVLDLRATGDVVVAGTVSVTGGDGRPGSFNAADACMSFGGGGGYTGQAGSDLDRGGAGGDGYASIGHGGGGWGVCARFGGGLGEAPCADPCGGGGYAGGIGNGSIGAAEPEIIWPADFVGGGGEILAGAPYGGGRAEQQGGDAGGGGGAIGQRARLDLGVRTTLRPGSGGGGGGRPRLLSAVAGSGGGGGGGGGAIRIASATSITIAASGRLLANGGAGGPGADGCGGGGGGGSGGAIVLDAPVVTSLGTLEAQGGAAGGPGLVLSGCTPQLHGGVGGLGRIRVTADTCTMSGATIPPALDAAHPCAPVMGVPGYAYVGPRIPILRTCAELHTAEPTLPTGVYELDADGASGPLHPFYATCDMTYAGGGWTMIMASAGLAVDHQRELVSVSTGLGTYLPRSIVERLASLGHTVHVRLEGDAATGSITSVADGLAIQNLRAGRMLNTGSAITSMSSPVAAEWTGPLATDATHLWGSSIPTDQFYPVLYWSSFNSAGLHIVAVAPTTFSSFGSADPIEVYVR